MTTYVLTWNPSKWHWEDFEEEVASSRAGELVPIRWSTGNTKSIESGDRLFMLRQHEDRGLIGAGFATSGWLEDQHWGDPDKMANYVEGQLDHLLKTELPIDTLDSQTDFNWNIVPASGLSLSDTDAAIVEKLWAEHLDVQQRHSDRRRNPKWQRDELILALDLYFRHPPKTISQTHESVVSLSELLNALPIHANRVGQGTFRNPNGVYMKLSNFLRLDPDYEGTGLSRGGKLEEEIWNEFAGDRERLRTLAKAIATGHQAATVDVQLDDEDELAFPEGRVLYRLHRQRERNTKLVKKKKKQAAEAGLLYCQVCSFDFATAYGTLGEGYIECHHTSPIAEYEEEQTTKLEDLALVCANCHRMLHRKRPWLTMQELGEIWSNGGAN